MEMYEAVAELVGKAQKIVVIQADNPDADSLGSALALEQILHALGKEPILVCSIDMPQYLRYLEGWDRVIKDIPNQFDLSVIVDTSSMTLLERLAQQPQNGWLSSRPCIVLDHHAGVTCDIAFASEVINDSGVVSTGELIYKIAKSLNWPLPPASLSNIMTSILADSQGLSNEQVTAGTYRVMAELVDAGVNRPQLEELRRQNNKMLPEIFRYKAKLIDRTELLCDGRLAYIVISQDEINDYSPLYNPNALIQGDQLQIKDVLISIAIKSYTGGRVTAGIRSSTTAPVAAELAKQFGGGGHEFAAGFKIDNSASLDNLKNDIVAKLNRLLP